MFRCAIACPRLGLLQILGGTASWGYGQLVIGNQQNINQKRLRGTLVWKNKVVTKEVYRELLLSKFSLAIIEKWPQADRLSRKICIQQDSAKSHIGEDDKEFYDALAEQDINVELNTQAVNSPDVNLLDLRLFQAIQSFNDAMPKNEEELIHGDSMAYDNYP